MREAAENHCPNVIGRGRRTIEESDDVSFFAKIVRRFFRSYSLLSASMPQLSLKYTGWKPNSLIVIDFWILRLTTKSRAPNRHVFMTVRRRTLRPNNFHHLKSRCAR